MKRLFFAVVPSPEVHQRIARALAELRAQPLSEGSRVSWVAPENLHVTVKFLGATPEEKVDSIKRAACEALAEVGSFELGFAGIREFPRLLWAGVDDTSGELSRVALQLDAAMAGLGFPAEKRSFKPHVALARIKHGRLPGLGSPDAPFGRSRVSEVVLFESRTLPTGAVYEAIDRFPIG